MRTLHVFSRKELLRGKLFSLFAMLSFVFLLPASVSAATRVFSDGFESGNTNLWEKEEGRNLPQVVSTVPHAGSKSASINWNGTVEWNTPNSFETMYKSFSVTNEAFTRFWIKIDPDMDTPQDGTGPKIFKWGDGNAKEVYLSPYMESNAMLQYFSNASIPVPTFWGSAASTIGTGNWAKIEHYMKTGNPGKVTVWVNDIQVYTWSGNTAVGGSWSPLRIASNWSGAPGTRDHDTLNHMYLDDVEIFSDSTTGTGTTGSMADGTITASSTPSDVTPPSVSLTAPANGATVSGSAVTLSATASDTGGINRVEFLVDGTLKGSDASSPYSLAWDTTNGGTHSCNGSHTHALTAKAYDTAGNLTTSAAVTVNMNNPSYCTSAPTATLAANPTSITSGQSSTLTWSSTNATACTSSGAWTGAKATSGTQSVSPTVTSTYTLTCTGTGGGTSNANATVTLGTGGGVSLNECQTMQSGWTFCNDFDTGVTSDAERRAQWSDYDGGLDVNFPLNQGPAQNSANHVAQMRAPVGASGGADLIKMFPNEYDRLYARWYIQYESGFNFNAPNHGGGLMAGDRDLFWRSDIRPNGSDVMTSWVDYHSQSPHSPFAYTYYRGMYQDCANPNGACWGDSFPCVYGSNYCTKPQHKPTVTLPNLQAGKWYCVEQTIDMGTPTTTGSGANGFMELKLDGNSLGSWNDLWLRTASSLKLNSVYLALYHHDGTHSTGGVLYDNVVISTQPIGCGSGTPPAPAPTLCHLLTPPSSTIPPGFAPPWNVYTNALWQKADCNANNTVLFTLGDAQPATYVWKQGYYTKNGTAWEPVVAFTGSTPSSDANWFIGTASFTTPVLTATQMTTQNSLAAYLCTYQATAWKCGCQNTSSCTPNGLWGVQGWRR